MPSFPIRLFQIVLLLLFNFSFVHSQNSKKNHEYVVKGVVLDSETNKPIPHVEIFISGTTRGCISNEMGNYELKLPFVPCTLVADHVSYESYIKNIDSSFTYLKILLQTKIISIEEIEIAGKSSRKQNLKYFYSRFMLTNRHKMEILNDSVLYFQKNETEFVAYCNDPLIIINKLLGYKIKLRINKFSVKRFEYPNTNIPLKSKQGFENVQIKAYYYFEPLITNIKQTEKYEKKRRLHYYGSVRHLLKSIYHNDITMQGFEFEVFPKNQKLIGFQEVKSLTKYKNTKSYILDCDSIKVNYNFVEDRKPIYGVAYDDNILFSRETSTIYRTGSYFSIKENGTSSNLKFTILGPLTRGNNQANSLPEDYVPEE